MDQDLKEVDIRAFTHKVTSCTKRINEFIGKLDSCDERMSLEGMDEQLLLSDSFVIETALDCCGDLLFSTNCAGYACTSPYFFST